MIFMRNAAHGAVCHRTQPWIARRRRRAEPSPRKAGGAGRRSRCSGRRAANPTACCGARSRPGSAATWCARRNFRSKPPNADRNNAQAFHVLAMALEKMGHQHKALVTYERAFKLDPEDPELLHQSGAHRLESENERRGGKNVPPLHRRLPEFAARLQQSRQHPVRHGTRKRSRSKRCAARFCACRRKRCCGIRWRRCWPKWAAPRKA